MSNGAVAFGSPHLGMLYYLVSLRSTSPSADHGDRIPACTDACRAIRRCRAAAAAISAIPSRPTPGGACGPVCSRLGSAGLGGLAGLVWILTFPDDFYHLVTCYWLVSYHPSPPVQTAKTGSPRVLLSNRRSDPIARPRRRSLPSLYILVYLCLLRSR